MSEQRTDLEQIEISIEEAKKLIDTADALSRLHKNKDFIKVIVEGYFKEESARAVLLRADPEMASDSLQKQVNDIITSIGGLHSYFHKTFGLAGMARESQKNDEVMREEILAEQLGEETL